MRTDDEGLKLVLSLFYRWLIYLIDFYFSVSLSHRRSTQFLSKLNPLRGKISLSENLISGPGVAMNFRV